MNRRIGFQVAPEQLAAALGDLVRGGPNARVGGMHRLVLALDEVEEGASLDGLRLLLGAGADPEGGAVEGEPTPLIVALSRGLGEAAALLLEAGASPCVQDEEGDTPLLLAVNAGDLAMVRALLQAGARACIDRPGGPAHLTPLQAALWRGDGAMAELLLEAGADPDLRSGSGPSARELLRQRGPAHPLFGFFEGR